MQAAAVVLLLGLGLGLQLYFFRHYPQPPLFGDPAGYYNVGLRFQDALHRVRAGETVAAVFASVRGLFFLLGVGTLFAVLDACRPGDTAFFRDVMAVANVATMLGVFVLARRLSGSFAAGLVGLAAAATYATFSVQTGRLYPDPLTAALLVWSAAAYARAILTRSAGAMAAAGGLLGLALLLRAQVLEYTIALVALALLATAWRWAGSRDSRRLVAALVLGLAPCLVVWGGIRGAVGSRDDVVRMGQVTFRPTYPFGFWQQLDTDGWTGPYRFKQDPFYKAMEEEARAGDPDLLRSRTRQALFTLRYVGARPLASALLVLDNAFRLYDRPANDYKWDYPYPYAAQVAAQRLLVVLGVAGAALAVSEVPALAGAFLMPAALALLHGLVFPWPRYNVPAMPILMAAAASFVVRAASGVAWRRPRTRRALLMLVVPAVLTLLLAAALRSALPEAARGGHVLGVALVLSLPFLLLVATGGARARRTAVAAGALVLVLFLAHAVRDRLWHETAVDLGGDVAAVEQAIRLSPDALGRLRAAPEAFVVFDLTVPRGDLQGATIDVGGRSFGGAALVPTMPRLRESTATGGRDRRQYPQWWALPLDPGALPASAAEPLRIRLSVPPDARARLRGDRFHGEDREYEGPSFGDWPHYAALKIEYDGDYRIPVTVGLGSVATESAIVDRSGRRSLIRSVHRIRVVVPTGNEGWIDWESAPAGAGAPAMVFAAYSGTRGEAQLRVDGQPALRFPLGAHEDFDVAGGGWRLCQRAEPPRQDRAYGEYVLFGPPPRPGAPVAFRAEYRAGLSQEPLFFVIDRRAPSVDLARAASRCGAGLSLIDGAARIVDATHNNYPEDTGRWTVGAVY